MIAPIKSRIPVAGRGSIYHLKITLAEVKPPIWRRLRVPGEAILAPREKPFSSHFCVPLVLKSGFAKLAI